jgi:ribose 5-phosphate isomerase B
MIYLGSDHAGFGLKQAVIRHLDASGKEYTDLGNTELNPTDDYPDYAFAVGEAVVQSPGSSGVLVCGSAQGVCIAANKVKGIRAVTALSREEAMKAREHNNANIVCLSGWNMAENDALEAVDAFLTTPFTDDGRHARRIEKIAAYENHG